MRGPRPPRMPPCAEQPAAEPAPGPTALPAGALRVDATAGDHGHDRPPRAAQRRRQRLRRRAAGAFGPSTGRRPLGGHLDRAGGPSAPGPTSRRSPGTAGPARRRARAMGPTRLTLSKPVIAAVEGFAVAGALSWRCGATCGWPPRMRSSACSAGASASPCRSGHGAAAPPHRPRRAMDLILTGRPWRPRSPAIGLANRSSPPARRSRGDGPGHQLAALPQVCLRSTGCRRSSSGASTRRRPRSTRPGAGAGHRSGETLEGAGRFAGGAGRRGAR